MLWKSISGVYALKMKANVFLCLSEMKKEGERQRDKVHNWETFGVQPICEFIRSIIKAWMH